MGRLLPHLLVRAVFYQIDQQVLPRLASYKANLKTQFEHFEKAWRAPAGERGSGR